MQLSTFAFANEGGWSVPAFPDLDSPQSLVVVFGAPEYIDAPAPLAQLFAA